MIMNKFRRLVPGFVLALTIALAGVSFAQNATQSGAGQKMDACCCCSDSCPMTKDGAMKNHATSSDKHDCCCGDSCATMKKDGAKSGAPSDKHECCGGDSCNMKEMKDMKKS